MPRERGQKRERAFELWRESKGKKKNKEIAAELGVSDSLVSRWKREDEWEKSVTKSFTLRKKASERKVKGSRSAKARQKRRLLNAVEKNEELTEKQKLFCVFYCDNPIATQAYLKAYECSYSTARVEGCKALTKPHIRAEINRLKKIRNQGFTLDGMDIVERMKRIAFADMTDFAMFNRSSVILYSSDMVDGCAIAEVKQTRDGGVSIKLKDSIRALMWLADYFELNPMDRHRKTYDKKILELKERAVKAQEEKF